MILEELHHISGISSPIDESSRVRIEDIAPRRSLHRRGRILRLQFLRNPRDKG